MSGRETTVAGGSGRETTATGGFGREMTVTGREKIVTNWMKMAGMTASGIEMARGVTGMVREQRWYHCLQL